MDRTQAEFVQHLLAVQARVKAYLRALVLDREGADELLQRTNLILCEKAEQFQAGSDFGAWACRTAYFEVLAYRQRYARKLAEEQAADLDDQRRALRHCLSRLPEKQKDLVHRRYNLGRGIGEIAQQLRRPVGSVRQTLFRIRATLMTCIEGRMRLEGHHA